MQPPKDYANLFLDMNAFFASIEQQVQPPLRGRPICIAPYTGESGCCIAKSYEAKSFGVKTGTLVGEAKKLCPQILIIESRPELYMFYHREILKVLKSFSPFVQVLSVDEFNIKLTGQDQNYDAAIKMAYTLKTAIREKVGDYMACSIGIGPNRWLAKVSGERKKPDGLVVITLKELETFYRGLTLLDLPGVNVQTARRLRSKKIKNPFDFYLQPLFNLSRWFGHPGRLWYYRLRGFETDEIEPATKSIGHQHVLAPECRTLSAARRVLVKMAEKCGHRLRQKNLWAGGVAIWISFLDGSFWRKNATTDLISDSRNIQRIVLGLYDSCRFQKPPLRIAVTLFNLEMMRGRQISLFSEVEKSRRLSEMMDYLNDKYGPETIFPAAMFGTFEAAPTRIPFGDPGRIAN